MKTTFFPFSTSLVYKAALSLFVVLSPTFPVLAQEVNLADSITVGEFLTTRKNALMQTPDLPEPNVVLAKNARQAVLLRVNDALARYTEMLYVPVRNPLPATIVADLVSIDLACRRLEGWPLPPYVTTHQYDTWTDTNAIRVPEDRLPPAYPYGPLNSQQIGRIKSHTKANLIVGILLGASLMSMASFVGIR